MHTEEEAKGLWCPHVRYPYGCATVSGNTEGEGRDHPDAVCATRCKASRCSQWRWEKRIQYPTFPAGSGGVSMHDSNFSNDDWLPETHNTDKGYCGLAGKP